MVTYDCHQLQSTMLWMRKFSCKGGNHCATMYTVKDNNEQNHDRVHWTAAVSSSCQQQLSAPAVICSCQHHLCSRNSSLRCSTELDIVLSIYMCPILSSACTGIVSREGGLFYNFYNCLIKKTIPLARTIIRILYIIKITECHFYVFLNYCGNWTEHKHCDQIIKNNSHLSKWNSTYCFLNKTSV